MTRWSLLLQTPSSSYTTSWDSTSLAVNVNVSMDDNFFQPSSITVTTGDTIIWQNDGNNPHTTTGGLRGAPTGAWDHQVSSGNSSPSVVFNTAGTFPYHCRFHFGMDGTVVVQEPPTPTPEPPTPTPTATAVSGQGGTPTAQPTATPPATVVPTSTPRPTRTPLPELTVVPEEQITTPDDEGGIVSVVHPTSPTSVELPEQGAKLDIPAPVQAETFQVRLRTVSSDNLPLQPDGRALSALNIDLFDTDGVLMQGVRLWSRATLSIKLTESMVQELGGASSVFNEHAAGRLRIQKLSPAGTSWSDLLTTLDLSARTFSASVLQFSTFALVWSGQPPEATATATVIATPTVPPTPSATPTVAAAPTVAPTPPASPQPSAPDTGDVAISTTMLLALAALGLALTIIGSLFHVSRGRR